MHKVTRSVVLALACSWLAGCSSDSTTLSSAGPNGFAVPPEGGVVVLPRTDNFAGTLKFAPGAAPGTFLTVNVSETAPPGALGPDVLTGPAQRDGFYYVTLATNKPLDFALLQSFTVRGVEVANQPNKPKREVGEAELFRAELDDVTGAPTYVQSVGGEYHDATSEAVFHEPASHVLQPNRSYLVQAKSFDVETLPTTIINNSGIPDAHICILGQNPNKVGDYEVDDPLYYRATADGELAVMKKSDRNLGIESNNQGGFNGYTDLYNIPVPNGRTDFNLPQMRAGRLYVSLGKKLQVRLEDLTSQPAPPPGTFAPLLPPLLLAQPNGWSNIADPNFKTLYDWVEFDYKVTPDTNKAGMGINKTEVDAFGLGIQIKLEGPTIGSKTTGTLDDGRANTFNTLLADNTFKSLVVPGPAQTDAGPVDVPVRIAAPAHGVENVIHNVAPGQVPTLDPHFFDQYVTDVWAKYKSEDLKAYTSAFGTWFGRVDAQDRMVFQAVDDSGVPLPGYQKILLRKPTTQEAFEPTPWIVTGGVLFEPTPGATPIPAPQPGPGTPAPKPGDPPALYTPFAASEIVSAMNAAFNRTTLLSEPLLTRSYVAHPANKLLFYARAKAGDVINLYAKAIHDDSIRTSDAPGPPTSNGGGAAYAFGFDDNSNQSSFLSENSSPTHLTITITKLK